MATSRSLLMTVGMLVLSQAAARGQGPEFLLPVEPAFEQAVAKERNGQLIVARTETVHVAEERTEAYPVTVKVAETTIDPATQKERVEYRDVTEMRTRLTTVLRPVYKQVWETLDLKLVTAKEIAGEPIPPADLLRRCAKETVVLVSTNGEPIPEAFAILFKPETIVLDRSQARQAAPPIPPPPPPSSIPVPSPVRTTPAPAAPAADDPFAPAVPRAVAPRERPMPAPLPVVTLPQGLPPQFRLLSIDANDQFVFRSVQQQKVTSTRFVLETEKRVVDDKEVETKVSKPIQVTERRETSHSVAYPASAITGQTVENKPLEEHHRAALRQREIPVVVSPTGQAVDPLWLQNVKPKMLVLITPSNAPPAPFHTVPAPAPKPIAE